MKTEVVKMTNEEFQKIVLEEFQKLNEKVGNLDGKVDNLEQGQKEIKQELNFMWDDIKRIDNRLAKQEGQIKFLHREL